MEEKEVGVYTKSYGVSFAIVSLFSALLVILKETNEESVLAWMKAATGHHWVTHGVLDILLFLVIGWVLAKLNGGKGINVKTDSLINYIFGSTVVSALLICVFFLV
jgi:hypothetical protein